MAANELETTEETVEEVKDDALEVEIVDSLEDEAEVKAEETEVKEGEAEEVEVKEDEVEEVEVKEDEEEVEEKASPEGLETTDVDEDSEVKDDDVESVLSELVETKAVEVDDVRVKRLTELGVDPETVTEDQFYCAESKSMETEVHDDCRGGCAPEGELPGLLDIEVMAAKTYEDGEIVRSGYADNERLFFVDIKREDGKYIEAAYSDDGEHLGWTLLDSETIDTKDDEDPIEAITMVEAEEIALKEFPGTSLSGQTSLFQGTDSYVFEIDTADGKSVDAYVDLAGEFIGYDEYELVDDTEEKVAMPVAAPAAAAKPAGDAGDLIKMIATVKDAETLGKVVEAIGDDVDVVPDELRAAIVAKANELKATDVLPEAWKKPAAAPAAAPAAPAAPAAAPAPVPVKKPLPEKSLEDDVEEKSSTLSTVVDGETDEEFAAQVAEFQAMTSEAKESE